MKRNGAIMRGGFQVFAVLACSFMPLSVWAGDDVLPPPTEHLQKAHTSGMDDMQQKSSAATKLNRDLVPDDVDQIEVRSYEREDGSTVTEHAVHGRVYMIRVQPVEGLPAYYLYDTDGDGVMEKRLPGDYKRIVPPMWVIKKF